MPGSLRRLNYFTAMVLAGCLLSTGAQAVTTATTSTTLLRIDNRTSNATQSTSAPNAFVDVTTASVPVSVPAGATRLYRVRFASGGRCDGSPGTGTCIVRIVALNTGTMATLELHPAAGLTSVFAPPTGTFFGAHAIERSARLPTGNYIIKAQIAVTGVMVGITVDDWHFTVETFQ